MMSFAITLIYFVVIGAGTCVALESERRRTGIELVAESFLNGIAANGIAAFLLSLVGVPLGRITWVAFFLLAFATLVVRRHSLAHAVNHRTTRHGSTPKLLLLLMIVPIVLIGADAAMLPLHDYDGRTFWIVKAKAIAVEESVRGPFFQGRGAENIHSQYPLLMPVNAATVMSLTSVDDRNIRWLYALTAVAFVFAVRSRLRSHVSAYAAALGATLLLWLPHFSFARDGGATSAYADIAVAAFVGLAFFDLLEVRLPFSFALWSSALLMTKNEGLPLAALLLSVAVLRHRYGAIKLLPVPVVSFVALLFWRRGVPLEHDENYGALATTLLERLAIVAPAARELLVRAFDATEWGFLWSGALAGAVFLLWRKSLNAVVAVVIIAVGLATYVAAYSVSSWILRDLAASSAHRLLLHLVAPALYLTVAVIEVLPRPTRESN